MRTRKSWLAGLLGVAASLGSASGIVAASAQAHASKHAAHPTARHHHRHHQIRHRGRVGNAIPQHNGGDRDADNNGAPSDGDGSQ